MKKNVLIAYPLDLLQETADRICADTPGTYLTSNLNQVLGMAQDGEINRVIILHDSINTTGQKSAERIHAIDPTIEIMVVGARDVIHDPIDAYRPFQYDKEYYFDAYRYEPESFFQVLKGFYEGILDYSILCIEYKGHEHPFHYCWNNFP